MAREVPDGVLCVGGLGTPLASAALAVAARAHQRRIWTISTDGGWAIQGTVPVALTPPHSQPTLRLVPFAELILEIVPRYQPFEFMRPAQLDRFGASNNVCVRRPDGRPVWLPGCGGIGDATSVNGSLVFYLPRHDRRTLVSEVDFASGAGRPVAVDGLPKVPRCVITELAVLRFGPDGPVAESLHPGVSADELRSATSFDVHGADLAPMTPPPDAAERAALVELDPGLLRDLEFASGRERHALLGAALES